MWHDVDSRMVVMCACIHSPLLFEYQTEDILLMFVYPLAAQNRHGYLTVVFLNMPTAAFLLFLQKYKLFEPQPEKTHLLTWAPCEDSNQPAHLRCLISLRCLHGKLYPRLSKCTRWALIPKFSDVAHTSAKCNIVVKCYVILFS